MLPLSQKPSEMSPPKRRAPVIVTLLGWVLMLGGGFRALDSYESTPGVRMPHSQFAQTMTSDGSKPLLVMCVHPRCRCSRASLEELAELERSAVNSPEIRILLWIPRDAGPEWAAGSVANLAATLPDAAVTLDRGGTLAKRLGATTSGEVFLYDRAGKLRFHGGITPRRGLRGNCGGVEALSACLAGRESRIEAESPTFGCGLFQASCLAEKELCSL